MKDYIMQVISFFKYRGSFSRENSAAKMMLKMRIGEGLKPLVEGIRCRGIRLDVKTEIYVRAVAEDETMSGQRFLALR